MITFNIVTRENAVSKLRLAQTTSTGGAAIYPVKMLLRTPESQLEIVPGSYDSTLLTVPPLPAGRYAFELLVGCETVASGTLIAQESVLTPGQACVSGVVYIDLPAVVFYLTPGGKGDKGDRGYSAYEIAVQNGYQGTEAEWVDAFNGAQAAVTAAKQSATVAQSAATAAETAKTDAQTAASTAETAKTDAQSAASTAETAKSDAQSAASSAETAKSDAQSAASTAETAKSDAQSAASTAETAKSDAQSAATAAAKSATDAAETLAGAAQVGANNTFDATTTNTFNGALVANSSLFYKQLDMNDWLTCSMAARLMEAGINPVSAFSETWEDWVALNPNWTTLEHLVFYAPRLQDSYIPPINTATSVSSCTYISPAATPNVGSDRLLGRKFKIFTLGTLGRDSTRCYNGTSCYYYAPRVETLVDSLNAFATNAAANTAELSVFTPELKAIAQSNTANSFRQLGSLKTFSIYAPKLVTSFSFADASSNGGKAQYCSVLHSLIAGIGTPDTEQTITTLTPIDNTDENISALQTAASAKKWQFNFV